MPAEGRENPLLKKGNSDAFFREKYLTKNTHQGFYIWIMRLRCQRIRKENHEVNDTLHNLSTDLLVST